MANSPIMSSLTPYIEQNRLPLIAKAVLKSKSAGLFNLQTGIKTNAMLNLLSTDIKFGEGLACGWSESGSQTLSQREIKTGAVKVNMAYCEKEFLKYWTQYAVRVAAGQKTLPFEEEFINEVIKNVNAKVETAIWQGDTDSSDVNLNKVDGLLKILGNEASVVKATISGTATPEGVYSDVMAVYNAIPVEAVEGASILVGADKFRLFVQKLVADNLYHYNVEAPVDEVVIPGTNVKVIAVNGLNGTGKIVAGQLDKNFFYGCDMADDQEKFEFWYSQDNREFRLDIEFNFGVQVAYPDMVVLGKTA